MIYLASPYTHKYDIVQLGRFEEVSRQTALLLKEGIIVFSPIVFSHQLSVEYGIPNTLEMWSPHNKAMIDLCDELWVLMLNGFRESKGVGIEVNHAKKIGCPVRFIHPGDLSPTTWSDDDLYSGMD